MSVCPHCHRPVSYLPTRGYSFTLFCCAEHFNSRTRRKRTPSIKPKRRKRKAA